MSHCPPSSLGVPSSMSALLPGSSASGKDDPTAGRVVSFSLSVSASAPWSSEHSEQRSCSYGNHDSSPRENTSMYMWVEVFCTLFPPSQHAASLVTTTPQTLQRTQLQVQDICLHQDTPAAASPDRSKTPFLRLCPELWILLNWCLAWPLVTIPEENDAACADSGPLPSATEGLILFCNLSLDIYSLYPGGKLIL